MARPAPLRPAGTDAVREKPHDPAAPAGVLVDLLPWPVIAADRNLRIVYANAAAAELFGIGLRSLTGRPLAEFWGSDSVAQALAWRALDESIAVGEDTLLVQRPDGHALRVSFDATPADAGAGGTGTAVLIALRDRTIADRLDRQAAHRDGARSFGALAGMLAHEVRNPLAGIRGAAQLLAPGLDGAGIELTDLICREVDRIVGVLDTVETLASGQPIATAAENIHEILDYVCTVGAAGFAQDRRLVREYDPSLPAVAGDRSRLIQAFLNLLKNAAEATATVGGEIRLATRFDPGLIHVGPDGTRRRIPVVVSITDDGPGIPETIREHLFDPFMTTKPQGRGLGLALVARIVADHGGAIDVASEPRRTRFEIMLPVAGADAAR
jgi:two-component system nitrogen regulation sensor histidine kinase GlnL